MNLFARILSHGFALVLVALLAVGLVYRGDLFPGMKLPGFLAMDSASDQPEKATAGTAETAQPAEAAAPDSAGNPPAAGEQAASSMQYEAAPGLPDTAPALAVEPAPVPASPEQPAAEEPRVDSSIPAEPAESGTPVPVQEGPATPEAAMSAPAEPAEAGTVPGEAASGESGENAAAPPEAAGSRAVPQEPVMPEIEPRPMEEPEATGEVAAPAVPSGTENAAMMPAAPEEDAGTAAAGGEVTTAPATESEQAETGAEAASSVPAEPAESELPSPAPAEAAAETAPAPAAGEGETSGNSSYQILAAAREAFWLRDYATAEQQYKRLIALDPDNPDGYGELGNMYFSQGEWDKASTAYFNAGTRLLKQGLVDEAQQLVEVIRGLNGTQADELLQKVKEATTSTQ